MGRAGPQQFETDPPITGGASGGFYEAAEAPTRAALPSLPESHRTIPFLSGASWFRKVLAFAGPGYLVGAHVQAVVRLRRLHCRVVGATGRAGWKMTLQAVLLAAALVACPFVVHARFHGNAAILVFLVAAVAQGWWIPGGCAG